MYEETSTYSKRETIHRQAYELPDVEALNRRNQFSLEGRRHLKRILKYGSLTLLLAVLLYMIMEDPGLMLAERFAYSPPFSWAELYTYASIVALVMFLGVLLLRYISVLFFSLFNATKDTFAAVKKPDEWEPVSIILPVYNEGKLLHDTLTALLNLDYPNYEILVVDDGSMDDTAVIARSFVGWHDQVEVRLIEKENEGKATALNAGILFCSHDLVLCVDGDSQIPSDALRYAVARMQDARIGAVAGNVKVINRDNMWTVLQSLEYVEGLNMVRAAQSFLKMVNIIPGPFGLFRKEAIMEAGWYSSDTFAEDCDMTLKVIRNGWHVEYEPESRSYTEAPEKLTNLLKQRYRWTRGIIQVVRQHKDLFFNPFIRWRGTFVMWIMAFESLVWPAMNLFATLYFIVVAVVLDLNYYILFWWVSLTILDISAALYSVAHEKEELRLIWYAIPYRIFFLLIIDTCKTFAAIEEFLGIGMTWGKLERTGSAALAPASTGSRAI